MFRKFRPSFLCIATEIRKALVGIIPSRLTRKSIFVPPISTKTKNRLYLAIKLFPARAPPFSLLKKHTFMGAPHLSNMTSIIPHKAIRFGAPQTGKFLQENELCHRNIAGVCQNNVLYRRYRTAQNRPLLEKMCNFLYISPG